MNTPEEATAKLEADYEHMVMPTPENQRIGRAIPALLAVAKAAAQLSESLYLRGAEEVARDHKKFALAYAALGEVQ